MKNTLYFAVIISTFLVWVIYSGCDDAGNVNITTGLYPDIFMKPGSVYYFTNDTLPYSGGTYRTRIRTTNTFVDSGTYYGQSGAFKISSVSTDTSTIPPQEIARDTFYVRYDKTAGKFYQYGLTQYVDTTQQPQWNVVADFSVTQGNEYAIANFNTIYYGFQVNIDIKGKIAENTTFQTTANPPMAINCYRVEIKSVVTPTGFPPAGTIYIDYFLGYSPPASNPQGQVRLKLRPFALTILSITQYYTGFDQILQTTTIP